MYCKNCGKEIKDGNEFCTNCGQAVYKKINSILNKKIIIFFILILIIIGLVTMLVRKNKLEEMYSDNNTVIGTEIDIDENEVYTLSDTSKNAINNIKNEIKIYAYGFEEDSSQIKLLKQYHETNEKINYEILTPKSNYTMIQEYDLKPGNYTLILKSEDLEKIIDVSKDFYTDDCTTYQKLDTTEQTITNSLLALTKKNKPKIYFTEGHGEFNFTEMQVLSTYLKNELFEINTLNLLKTDAVPDDCDVLAIMSPTNDIMKSEAQSIKNYINKGGNIYYSQDVVSEGITFPNLQTVLDEFGVAVLNGYTLEYEENKTVSQHPNIFMPEISSTNEITQDIYKDSYMWLVYAGKLNFADDTRLQNLNVQKETLLSSTDNATFVTNLSLDLQAAKESGILGKSEIASLLTKTITTTNENGESSSFESKLIVSASGNFISDYAVKELDENNPVSYLGSNINFVINSMAFLSEIEKVIIYSK